MAASDLLNQLVDGLLQGFHPAGGLHVRCLEAADGQVQDVIQRGEQHLQLFPGAVREPELLVVELLGGLLDVHGMVADPLEVPDGVEQAGNRAHILHGQPVLGDLHQVAAEPVLVNVQLVLVLQDLGLPLPAVLGELVRRQADVLPGGLSHAACHGDAFADCRAGGPQQQGIQEGEALAGVLGPHQSPRQLFQLAGEGQEQDRGEHVKGGVAEGDAHGPHGLIQEGEVEDHVAAVEEDQAHGGADDVEGDVDHRHSLGVAVDADGADEGGDAGADVLPHNDGDGHAVGDGAGHGQGLQNGDRGSG